MFEGQLVASKLVLVVLQLVSTAYKHDVLVAITTSLTYLYTFVVLASLGQQKFVKRYLKNGLPLVKTYIVKWGMWVRAVSHRVATISKAFEQSLLRYIQSIHLYRLYSFQTA